MKNIERMISTVVGKTKLLPFHVLGEDIAAIQNGYQQSCIHVFFYPKTEPHQYYAGFSTLFHNVKNLQKQ
jgi:hypothetical protein